MSYKEEMGKGGLESLEIEVKSDEARKRNVSSSSLETIKRRGFVATFSRKGKVDRKFEPGKAQISTTEASGGSGGLLIKSWFFLVLAPTCAVFIYFIFMASDVYVSEAKITVREASAFTAKTKGPASILGQIDIGKSGGTAQDSLIVAEYIKSRAILDDIGGIAILNKIYGRDNIDYISKLAGGSNIETGWEYWKAHVTASVDSLSGILTLRVLAYAPDDALLLSSKVIDSSEKLINQISRRSKEDALERAKSEVELAVGGLADARGNLLKFQQSNQTIDPTETAKQVLKLISGLTLQKTAIESELATSASMGIANKPGELQAQAKLDAIEGQINKLHASLTGRNGGATVSTQLRDFELLKVQQEFAEYMYKLARNGFERARLQLEQQDLYLAVVVPPTKPETATYPRPASYTALIFAGLFIVWGILALVAASIKDSIN